MNWTEEIIESPSTEDDRDRRKTVEIARVLSAATRVFGNPAKARLWLNTPNRSLDDAIPMDLLDSTAGRDTVEQTLLKIEHGIYS